MREKAFDFYQVRLAIEAKTSSSLKSIWREDVDHNLIANTKTTVREHEKAIKAASILDIYLN